MNILPPQKSIFIYFFRFWLYVRRFLPRIKCQTFGINQDNSPRITKIFVINLNREHGRWNKMKQELHRILESSGKTLLSITERYSAIDGNEFLEIPTKSSEIDPIYTLADQLFVEPQPLTLPTELDLTAPIKMSAAEYAVAQSHINIWKLIASGNEDYVLLLEDDVWFHSVFQRAIKKVWSEIFSERKIGEVDILYLSYLEVKDGAPKTLLSDNLFRPDCGLWHLSGYVLSREGAKKLLNLLPCRGPVDLWINHHFKSLNVLATKQSVISQRRDTKSTNSYSILPSLTKIGAITSEGASLFNSRPTEQPVFAFGPKNSGLTPLAMALSMLGYTCCNDLMDLPVSEMINLMKKNEDKVFNAYVNIGCLEEKIKELRIQYPKAKFILTGVKKNIKDDFLLKMKFDLIGSDFEIIYSDEVNKWQLLCEHLRCSPPKCPYPSIIDFSQRKILNKYDEHVQVMENTNIKHDDSPWIIKSHKEWFGIKANIEAEQNHRGTSVKLTDNLENYNAVLWQLRNDTFTDNLALFNVKNVEFKSGFGAKLTVKRQFVGVRDYTAGSFSSVNQYLYGKFEARIQASNVPGIVTGFFLFRNSPRQEIDIEIMGNRPDRLLVNVFYNPGSEGDKFDYGYRGSPTYIDLGFDASEAVHHFTIEWSPDRIQWLVDGKIVHTRAIWAPTPIPHLPMTLHVNSWISRSAQLAGRINNHLLPSSIMVREISLSANPVLGHMEAKDYQTQLYQNNL